MLLFRMINYICGTVCVGCGEDSSRLLDLMLRETTEYWELKYEDGGISFMMLWSEYKELKEQAQESGIHTKVLSRKGLPCIIRRYRRRIGIPLGVLLFYTIIRLSGMFIWDIEVTGNEMLLSSEITDQLESLGCGIGSYIPDINFKKLCDDYMIRCSDTVAWISVNLNGTVANVEVIEKQDETEAELIREGTPCNLVAERDGLIVRTESISGSVQVKTGQVVEKGQLLVSGIVEIGRGEEKPFTLAHASGAVYAQTVRRFEVRVDAETEEKTATGEEYEEKSIIFFGKNIKVCSKTGILPEKYDKIIDENRITLFPYNDDIGNIRLPVIVRTEKILGYTNQRKIMSEDECRKIARKKLNDEFAEQLGDAEIISRTISESTEGEGDSFAVILTCEAVCVEDIAERSLIGVK